MRACPQFRKSGQPGTPCEKKRLFWGGKTPKKLAKFFLRLRDVYKKYILQKNWTKTAISALSSGQSNLHPPIWGRHRQLDDHHRNPNINDRDHLVGQLTTLNLETISGGLPLATELLLSCFISLFGTILIKPTDAKYVCRRVDMEPSVALIEVQEGPKPNKANPKQPTKQACCCHLN